MQIRIVLCGKFLQKLIKLLTYEKNAFISAAADTLWDA